jgi:hypothetical protein
VASYVIPRNLFLFFIQNNPAIIIPSFLLFCVKDTPAIMTFSLQLIVTIPSLLLFCVKDALAIMMAPLANFSLQLIDVIFLKNLLLLL